MNAQPERAIQHWVRLRSSGKGDGAIEVPSLPSLVETGFGPVRYATGPQGQPRLLVPVAPGSRPLPGGSKGNGKLSLAMTPFGIFGKTVLFIDLVCLQRSLDAVFAELADEIVHRIGSGHAPREAVTGAMADFRELLSAADQQEAPLAELTGLIGELLVLRHLVRLSPAALDAWTGPFGQRHDFRRNADAIEVKTSARADAGSVTISSIEQLSEPAGGTLTLFHVRIERSSEGELSVNALFGDIVRAGASELLLRSALAAMGCEDPAAPAWNAIRFHNEALDAYRVEEGFPRIGLSSFAGGLPEGVGPVQYGVDLRSAARFVLSDGALTDALRRIAL